MRVESDPEAVCRFERLENVGHHIDLGPLVTLSLTPPDWIVEEVEGGVGLELAVEMNRFTSVDHEDLPL